MRRTGSGSLLPDRIPRQRLVECARRETRPSAAVAALLDELANGQCSAGGLHPGVNHLLTSVRVQPAPSRADAERVLGRVVASACAAGVVQVTGPAESP